MRLNHGDETKIADFKVGLMVRTDGTTTDVSRNGQAGRHGAIPMARSCLMKEAAYEGLPNFLIKRRSGMRAEGKERKTKLGTLRPEPKNPNQNLRHDSGVVCLLNLVTTLAKVKRSLDD